jgi:hypothetical protein
VPVTSVSDALTYRPSPGPAVGFDGREDGLRVLTRTSDRPIIRTGSIKARAVGFASLDNIIYTPTFKFFFSSSLRLLVNYS